MTSKEIEERLAKYKKSLSNTKISDADKARIRTQIEVYEQKLAEVQAAEEVQAGKQTAQKSAGAKKATSSKTKITEENKSQAVANCAELVGKLKRVLDDFAPKRRQQAKAKPVKTKRVSTVVADGIAGTVERVIRRMVKKDKTHKVNIGSLREARDKFSQAIRSLRAAFGGASSDADSYIEAFQSRMNELIDQLEKKAKDTKKEQTAEG